MVIARTEVGNFLDHVALLIDLNWEDTAVLIVVSGRCNRTFEGFIDGSDAVIKQIFNPQNGRHF